MQERVIEKLIGEGFIDELRFACTFARSKFHNNQWGRIKIAHALRRKNVPEHYISESLKEIGHQEYEDTLRKLIHKKYSSVKGATAHEKNKKQPNRWLLKGFESDLVFELIFNQEII
ncbi:MAG: regulatory protein RecX [Bacteroidales bacterium]|nr:regulatory protein RecX [Bacteroidales bacterium]